MRRRLGPELFQRLTTQQKRRLRQLNTPEQELAAASRARLSKKIQSLERHRPAQLLAIANAHDFGPARFMAMQRLIGRPGAPWIFDKRLFLMAFVFLRAFLLLGLHLPRRLRGNGRALALGVASDARRMFREKHRRIARGGTVQPGQSRAVALMVSHDLQVFFEWLTTVEPGWCARVRQCRGCKRFFWDRTLGRPKETCNATCRQRRIAPPGPLSRPAR